MRRPVIVLPIVAVLGCSGAPARSAGSRAVAAPLAAARPAAAACGGGTAGASAGTLVDTPVVAGARVRVRAPSGRVAVEAARATDVQLDVDNAALGPETLAVAVALDTRAPRRIESVGQHLTLGDLVFEDDAIAPGRHVVVAALVRAQDGAVVSANADGDPAIGWASVIVGAGAPPVSAPEPMLFLSEPHGTYNGGAADHVLVSFAPFGERVRRDSCIRLGVLGPSLNSSTVARGTRSVNLADLPSGDYDVTAEIVETTGVFAAARRSFVVNRDAPLGGTP